MSGRAGAVTFKYVGRGNAPALTCGTAGSPGRGNKAETQWR